MRLYGLRILIALITFASGVAAASLWGYLRAPLSCPAYGVVLDMPSTGTVSVAAEIPTASPAKADALELCKLGQLPPDAGGKPGGSEDSLGPIAYFGLPESRLRYKSIPKYPAEAKAAGVEGEVKVQILVGEEGEVLMAKALSGHELLRDAALDGACRSRFTPTLVSGWPVSVWGVLTYKFVLQ